VGVDCADYKGKYGHEKVKNQSKIRNSKSEMVRQDFDGELSRTAHHPEPFEKLRVNQVERQMRMLKVRNPKQIRGLWHVIWRLVLQRGDFLVDKV